MEPVTFALAGLSWVVAASVLEEAGITPKSVLEMVLGGILGNEAHRLYRTKLPRLVQGLTGLSLPENHDLARAVRSAQFAALALLCKEYRAARRAAWHAATEARPTDFLDGADTFCRDGAKRCDATEVAFDLNVTDTLRAAFEGLLADPVPGGPAGLRAEALAEFAEEAVLAELRGHLGTVAIPPGFEAQFRGRAEGRQGFLALFGAFFSDRIKPDTPARAIMTTRLLARIEGLAFDSTEILVRIEHRFGALLVPIKQDTKEILRRQDEEGRRAADRHAAQTDAQLRLERLVMDAAGGGAPAVRAIADIRELLRPANADIDAIPAEQLPGLMRRILDELVRPAAPLSPDLPGAVRHAIAESERLARDLRLAEATAGLDAAIAQRRAARQDEAFADAALLAERGRLARLALRYREAAGFHGEAADLVGFDAKAAWAHRVNSALALSDQGREFGDNDALREAIAAYGNALALVPRARVPLDWAGTQNNLGNALQALGEREAGTARLKQAVAAYRAALEELTRARVPLDWARTQNNLGNALLRLGEREAGTARLEEAVVAYRAALEEWTRTRVPLDWARTQNNLGNALRALGAREAGTVRLEEAVAAYRAALEELTRARVPLDWATTQNNLGDALQALGAREAGTARLEEAVAAFEACLSVAETGWLVEWVQEVRRNRDAAREEIARRRG